MSRGLRPAGLEEAQVTRRDLGVDREVELAHATALAPFAQVISDRPDCCHAQR